MSGFGVEPEDMRRATVLDKKLDALLTGGDPVPGDELAAELSLMLQELESAFPAAVVSEQVEDVHIARMIEAARESVAPATAPMAPANAPMAPARSSLLDRMRAGVSQRVAAASLAFTAAFGGAAYAGVLPAPVQRAVANAAGAVGLELPKPGDDDKKGRSVAGDPQDEDDRDPAEPTVDRSEDESRAGDGTRNTGDGGRDSRRGSGQDSDADRTDGDRRDGADEREDDDDAGDTDDSDLDRRDDRSRDGGDGRESDDDDDVDYDAPEADDSDSDEDAIEPDDDDEDSSFDEQGARDSDERDELEIDSGDVQDASDL